MRYLATSMWEILGPFKNYQLYEVTMPVKNAPYQ